MAENDHHNVGMRTIGSNTRKLHGLHFSVHEKLEHEPVTFKRRHLVDPWSSACVTQKVPEISRVLIANSAVYRTDCMGHQDTKDFSSRVDI